VILAAYGDELNLVKKGKTFTKEEAEISSKAGDLREVLCILASWFLSQTNKTSVLEELRVRRLAVIQEEIC